MVLRVSGFVQRAISYGIQDMPSISFTEGVLRKISQEKGDTRFVSEELGMKTWLRLVEKIWQRKSEG